MKLSELSTDKSLDVLCSITPYINGIVTDEELVEQIKKKLANGEEHSRLEILHFGAEKINVIIPIVLKKHRADVYGILSVLNEKTVEEIGVQNIIKTMMQIRDAVKDKELVDFFKSCAV